MRWAVLGVLLVLGPLWMLGGCTTNAATGEKQLALLGREDEIRLGEEAAPKMLEQSGGELPSQGINRYVEQIGQKLAGVSEREDLPWEFYVVNSPVVNAFALPGGKVFVSRGLLEKMKNEAQLAGVLGHEIGHVTAQHVNQRMSRSLIVQGIATGLGAAGQVSDKDYLRVLGAGASVGGTLYLLDFSRGQESQSDHLGVRYMSKVGYNPVGQVQLMRILEQQNSGGSQLAIFSTHPNPKTRIRDLQSLIRKQYPHYDDGRYKFYEHRFENQVLKPLAKLPPPPEPQPQPSGPQPQPRGNERGKGLNSDP